MLLTCLPCAAWAAKPDSDAAKTAKHRAATAAFLRGPIVELHFEISNENLEALRNEPRRYVEARLKSDGKQYRGVAVKLKGADGSFKPIDAKPGLTVNLDLFKGAERFHGMKKFHLNNANEDPSFLRQLICGEIARAADVPAVRCIHAFVRLNDRDLGLYVFTEGFTKDFLAQSYKDPSGDLYEGGFCKDIDEDLQKDEGDKKDFRAIEQLLTACREEDAAARWKKLGAILDTERFASFLAMESLLGVGDGYNFFHNNYRLYHDPVSQKLSFILHGMDQPLGDAGFPIQGDPGSIVGRAFVSCVEGRALYRARVGSLYEKVFSQRDWPARVAEVSAKVRAAMTPRDAGAARELAGRMDEFRTIVGERVRQIAQQLAELPEPLTFDKSGAVRLTKGWATKYEEGANLERVPADGRPCLRIKAAGQSQASWRTGAQLPGGRYRFESHVSTRGVEGPGAGLRISGQEPSIEWVRGDSDWRNFSFEFDVPGDGGEIVLVAELRANKGEARFALDSLRLVRLESK